MDACFVYDYGSHRVCSNESINVGNDLYDFFVATLVSIILTGKAQELEFLLAHYVGKLVDSGKKHLTVYADNCSGQNKNNYVIKFLLAQVDMGRLEQVDYKLFVKGHTKKTRVI
ncbi:hypothetical protein PC114_g14107 [Phytophthora cactorum]|nr:hypothetical protein PC114_g14107 [Phytophthora cactorum]KAG3078191.1 hypothetical protein PC122_g12807 [Phytophthora cactorum]